MKTVIFALFLVWSLLLLYRGFNLHFGYYDCTQSWIHLWKWLDSKVQHTHSLHPGYQCAPLLIVPLGTPYGKCWKIYCCHLWFLFFFLFLKCAALHKDDVGKILPYYPIMKRTSKSAAFICRQLVSCTIFILLRGKAPVWCCTTICWEDLQADAAAARTRSLLSASVKPNIDSSVCHWWDWTTAVLKLAVAW